MMKLLSVSFACLSFIGASAYTQRSPLQRLSLAGTTSGSTTLNTTHVNAERGVERRGDPKPPVWPELLHGTMNQNRSGALASVELYYDWVGGRNLNVITDAKTGSVLYDNERNNGTTYYYHLPPVPDCKPIAMGVGILRPDWLSGADYLGTKVIESFMKGSKKWVTAQVFAKDGAGESPFVTYYHNNLTNTPVRWVFFDNATFDVVEWHVGEGPVKPSVWDIPDYCF